MILVDTSAWAAIFLPGDGHHVAATRWYNANRERLLVTDYIVDETLTLLRARRRSAAAVRFGQGVFDGTLAELHFLSRSEIDAAWDVFRRYSDKAWSFTDCSSMVVMERLGIAAAFAFDGHFRQFARFVVEP